ncbi:NAD kinase [Pseudonocardiaceae bacterium YIM PH 21723]|nr:NAD kinase [Pseudonocardiaceae bacterium YIM PH 21723]
MLMVVHTGHPENLRTAERVAKRLLDNDVRVRILESEARDLSPSDYCHSVPDDEHATEGVELTFVLGGDGTLLRAAEVSRPTGVPVFGVNLGRVGFLTGADADALDDAVQAVIERTYHVEERMTVDVTTSLHGDLINQTWALNEASVEKSSRERILDVLLEIDGKIVSGFGCDGILCATPTGSTAYTFSAGGPILWPDVNALLVVPSNAHALFTKPMVVSPGSKVAVEIDPGGHPAVLSCDGRRSVLVPPGARVEVTGSVTPVRLAWLREAPFSDRLVDKFTLPVRGWRNSGTE